MAELSNRKWYSGMTTQEDWWAVWLGLTFFFMGLTTLFGVDLVGCIAYPNTWVFNLPEGAIAKKIVTPENSFYALGGKHSLFAQDFYKSLGLSGSMLSSYIILTIATTAGAFFMKWNVKRFFIGWTLIFFMTYLVWFIGHHAFFAATAVDLKKNNMSEMFTLSLGGGASFILALIV